MVPITRTYLRMLCHFPFEIDPSQDDGDSRGYSFGHCSLNPGDTCPAHLCEIATEAFAGEKALASAKRSIMSCMKRERERGTGEKSRRWKKRRTGARPPPRLPWPLSRLVSSRRVASCRFVSTSFRSNAVLKGSLTHRRLLFCKCTLAQRIAHIDRLAKVKKKPMAMPEMREVARPGRRQRQRPGIHVGSPSRN